jgi:GNAT superfamily N-acetyltransferase
LEIRIEPLGKNHDPDTFSCGKPTVDNYLRGVAKWAISTRQAATYVAVRPEDPNRIVGYVTLVGKEVLANELAEKFPANEFMPEGTELPASSIAKKQKIKKVIQGHTYPCILLAQLGVQKELRKKGIGGHLMITALQKSVEGAHLHGAIALITDPLDEEADSFYRTFGFEPMPSGKQLALPMREIEKYVTVKRERELKISAEQAALGEVETVGQLRTELESVNIETSVLLDFSKDLNQDDTLSTKQSTRQVLEGIESIKRVVTDLRAFKAQRERRESDEGPSQKR